MTARCKGGFRHWFTYPGIVGSSSITCVRHDCNALNPAYRFTDDPLFYKRSRVMVLDPTYGPIEGRVEWWNSEQVSIVGSSAKVGPGGLPFSWVIDAEQVQTYIRRIDPWGRPVGMPS